MRRLRTTLAALGVLGGCSGLVLATLQATVQSWRAAGTPGPALAEDIAAAASGALAAALAGWLLIAVAASVVEVLVPAGGHRTAGARLAGKVAPLALRRAVAALLGAGVVGIIAPTAAGATPATQNAAALHSVQVGAGASGTSGASDGRGAGGGSSGLDPGWAPGGGRPVVASTPVASTPVASTPVARTPVASTPVASERSATTAARPAASEAPATRRPVVMPAPDRRPGPSADGQVVVRRGDTLWAVAARYLGPGATAAEVAQAWPRWYSANRTVIGPDPDHIEPGMRLHPPRTALGGTR